MKRKDRMIYAVGDPRNDPFDEEYDEQREADIIDAAEECEAEFHEYMLGKKS